MSRPISVEDSLAAAAASPDDERALEIAAMALTRVGRDLEACELLVDRLINLTAHDGPSLPCLCRRCLVPAQAQAQAEGIGFYRRFAVTRGRVLFYWAPAAIARDPGLADAVRDRLDARLAGARS